MDRSKILLNQVVGQAKKHLIRLHRMSQELVEVFLEEAQDLLVTWERCVLELQKKSDIDRWNELFRAAHNLKGSSQSVGLLGIW